MKTKVGSVLCHTLLRCYEAVELQGTGAVQTGGAAEPTRRGWTETSGPASGQGEVHQAKEKGKNRLCNPHMCPDMCSVSSVLKSSP